MSHFRPYFVGLRQVAGLDIPVESSWIANRGGLAGLANEARFRLFGPGGDCLGQLRAVHPQILHAHFAPDACESIPVAANLGIPLIATFHGYDATLTDEALAATRHGRRYLRRRDFLKTEAALFVAVSNFIAKQVQRQGYPSDRIVVHHIGVDLSKFVPPINGNRGPQVLFVARLVEKKGGALLIKSMKLVQESFPDAELVIIGDGPERQALEAAAERSLRKYKFLGRQEPSVVIQWMQKASVFCVPSVTASDGDAEGFGMVFAEAQGCGAPVVTFSSGGTSDAVLHNETGFLAPEGDWRKLADSILTLLKNPGIRERFSHAGRERAEEKFDLRKQTPKLEKLYEDVISKWAAARPKKA
jgi:glycosyltransferase involved in cell wall biosynthesis